MIRFLIILLACVSAFGQRSFDSTPWKLDVYTNVADMVAHASPVEVNKAVRTLGYWRANDGGGGIYYATNAITRTNRGDRFVSALDASYSFDRIWTGAEKDARGFGVKGDGSNDSAAIQDAIYSFGTNSGTVYIPRAYFNITILTNVTLRGDGSIKDYRSGVPSSFWAPYDSTQPLIKIGNDSGYVRGVSIQNATMFGNSSTSAGVYFAGGAFECFVNDVSVWKFKTNFYFKGGTTYPCSLIFVDNFTTESSGAANSRAIYAYHTGGSGYTSAIYFSNGHVNGNSGSGEYALESDGVQLSMANVYFDCGGDDHGWLFKKSNVSADSAWVNCSNVTIDSNNSSDALINGYLEIRDFGWWAPGASVDGKLLLPSTARVSPTGVNSIGYQRQANFFQVIGEIALVDNSAVNGYDARRRFWSDGALNGENVSGNVNLFSDQNITLQATNGAVILKGIGGGVVIPSGNVFLTNGVGIYFKNPVGTDINILSSSGYGIALAAPGNVNLNPGTNLVINPGEGVVVNPGSSAAFSLINQDLYLNNRKSILWKDLGGTYRQIIALVDTNMQVLNTATGKLVIGAMDATYGALDLYTGGILRWHFDENGDLLPGTTYNIGSSSFRFGTAYGTKFNLSGSGFISSDVTTPRTITGGSLIDVTNGDGASGNPTIAFHGIEVKEADGSPDVTTVRSITVSNGTLTDNGSGSVTITTGGGSGYSTVQEEGSGLTARATLNFIGGGVTAADNSGSSKTDVSITRAGIVREVWFPAAVMHVDTNVGSHPSAGTIDLSENGEQKTWDFDDTANELMLWSWVPPEAWNTGTVKAKVYWTATTGTATQGVRWCVGGGVMRDGDTWPSFTTQCVTDTYQGSGVLHISSATSAITLTGTLGAGNFISFRVTRSPGDASDTKTGDAKLLGVMIQYTESSTEPSAW